MNRRRRAAVVGVVACVFAFAFAATGAAAGAQTSTTAPVEDVIGEPLAIERPAPGAPITGGTTTSVRPTAVLGVELQRPSPVPRPTLARTGIDAFGLTVVGVGLVGLGDLLLWGARRRRHRYAP